jgi:hypothetical protein
MPRKTLPRLVATVTITERHEIDHMPATCSMCLFADLCDGHVGKLTKRHPHCPMTASEA